MNNTLERTLCHAMGFFITRVERPFTDGQRLIRHSIGSVCFLAASHLALIEVSHRSWSFQPRQVSWWIVTINLLGSIAFMLAALFSFFLPSDGSAYSAWSANLFTLLGALCFLLASYLMIPELFGAARTTDTP
jgi:hypothetical protein